jgi:hypothetical protein
MLKTVFSALAVTAVLATGAAFAADQTSSAPAAAVSQPATQNAVKSEVKASTGKSAEGEKHVTRIHAKAAPETASPATPAKAN